MSNAIKIKRGSTTPTTANLTSYELGFDTASKILYINDNGTIVPIGNSFIGNKTSLSILGAAPSTHTHTKSDITDFTHTHTKSQITDFTHTHTKSQITDFSHTHTSAEISNWDTLLEKLFPVGAIYISATEQSPAPLFSYETNWDKITNRFLVGAGDTYTSGATGGSATHTLTVAEMPSHSHSLPATHTYADGWGSVAGPSSGSYAYWNYSTGYTGGGGTQQLASVLRRLHLQTHFVNPSKRRKRRLENLKHLAIASARGWTE